MAAKVSRDGNLISSNGTCGEYLTLTLFFPGALDVSSSDFFRLDPFVLVEAEGDSSWNFTMTVGEKNSTDSESTHKFAKECDGW